MTISTNWPGTSAWIRFIFPPLFLVSLTAWALGIAFTVEAANHDMPTYGGPPPQRVPTSEMYFYTCALPMATTFAAAIDFVLYKRNLLSPIASIVWGIFAFIAWWYMIFAWWICELGPDSSGSGCPNIYVYGSFEDGLYQTDLLYARMSMGSVALVLALTQMAFGARAVDLRNKERKKSVVGKERDEGRSFELEDAR